MFFHVKFYAFIVAVYAPSFCGGFMRGGSFTGSSLFNLFSSINSRVISRDKQQPFSEELVNSLDLTPLIYGVSEHAGTRRGKEALLSLVSRNTESKKNYLKDNNRQVSKRTRISEDCISPSCKSTEYYSDLVKIASSLQEAQDEYELVREASLAISEFSNKNGLVYPPLYGADSSPDNIEESVDTDDDDWLWLDTDKLNLEHVLQAEQVIITLLKVKKWAISSPISESLPGLSAIGDKILCEELSQVMKQISDAVEIKRVKKGVSAYIFQLRDGQFPEITELHLRIERTLKEIDNRIKPIMKKMKGSSEYVDYDGRRVILVPKSVATSIDGVVRGREDSTKTRYYVEPASIIPYGDELQRMRMELKVIESNVEKKLIQAIVGVRGQVDTSLQHMARLDVIFSKAAFGKRFNGAIPKLDTGGGISIEGFVHPVLALKDVDHVIPTDLHLANELVAARSLIISGPNGGGKSVSMKSFGLACLMSKVAIPILQKNDDFASVPRLGFFNNVFVEHGHQQDLIEGESTFMARLNACSSLIQDLQGEQEDTASLILLDELGGGTDPVAGGFVGQALMEKMLESKAAYIVATTHSPHLKALSFNNKQFSAAAMLLKQGSGEFKLPTYQLKYGIISGSYALDAISRTEPPLPEDVLSRMTSLISSDTNENKESDTNGKFLQALTRSLEKQLNEANTAREEVENIRSQIVECKDALSLLSSGYMKRYNEIEERLQSMVYSLENDETNSLKTMGNTIDNLKLVKKKVKSKIELMKERGLRPISEFEEVNAGKSVVIVDDGPLDGMEATVVSEHDSVTFLVELEGRLNWDVPYSNSNTLEESKDKNLKLFSRHSLAVWDYDSVWDDEERTSAQVAKIPSIRESRARLESALSKIVVSRSKKEMHQIDVGNQKSSPFTSSRERKANKKKEKNKKKKKKKK